jgi:CubicO group peptidase (beta-lactamase class C family)
VSIRARWVCPEISGDSLPGWQHAKWHVEPGHPSAACFHAHHHRSRTNADSGQATLSAWDLRAVFDQELKPVLERGVLSKPGGGGLVIGVLDHGDRRIFTYGTARPDSIFEIGSITKTFSGLILAQMVV